METDLSPLYLPLLRAHHQMGERSAAGGGSGRGGAEALPFRRWPDDPFSRITSSQLAELVGPRAVQYAFFYDCLTMNSDNPLGFMNVRDGDSTTKLASVLFWVMMSNHCRRGVISGHLVRPAKTVLTVTEVTNPADGQVAGFMFLMWEIDAAAPIGEDADEGVGQDQKVGRDQRDTLQRRNRDKLPFSEWVHRIFCHPRIHKLVELSYTGSRSQTKGNMLDDNDRRDWKLLCAHDALDLWVRGAAAHISHSSEEFEFNRKAAIKARLNPQFSDQAWDFGPCKVFSVANAAAHAAKRAKSFHMAQDEKGKPVPISFSPADYVRLWSYNGGPPKRELDVNDRRLPDQYMSDEFCDNIDSGRTWIVTGEMAHPRLLQSFYFPAPRTDTSFDTNNKSWRNYMMANGQQVGHVDATHKAHQNYVDVFLSEAPIAADFDQVQAGIRARALEINKIADRGRRLALQKGLADQFPLFWNVANKDGGPLTEWIKTTNDIRRDRRRGFSFVGDTHHTAPHLSAIDSFMDTMFLLGSRAFHITYHLNVMFLLLMCIADCARRGMKQNTVRLQLLLYSPPGTGKTIITGAVKDMLPPYAINTSDFDTAKTALSLKGNRCAINFRDEVDPVDLGCPDESKIQAKDKTLRAEIRARREYDPTKNTGGGLAVRLRKSLGTGSTLTSRAATIDSGHRDAVTTRSVDYSTTVECGNVKTGSMNYALLTRLILIPVLAPKAAGVTVLSSEDSMRDAEQIARFTAVWTRVMCLVVMLNSQIESHILPDVDTTIPTMAFAALVTALQSRGYGSRDIASLRRREEGTYIARSKAVVGAIITVFGDLEINAPDATKPYEHRDLRLLQPLLWISHANTFYAAGTPNLFVEQDQITVAKVLARIVHRFAPSRVSGRSGAGAAPAKASASAEGAHVSLLPDSRSGRSVDSTADAQLAEIDNNLSQMGGQIPFNMRAENLKRGEDEQPIAREVFDGYSIVTNFFDYDQKHLSHGYTQPHDDWYTEKLVLIVEALVELKMDRSSIVNAVVDLTQDIVNDGGIRRPAVKYVLRDLLIDMNFIEELQDPTYRTLQRLYQNRRERVVWHRFESNNDKPLTGVVGGCIGGISYEDLVAHEEKLREVEEKAHEEAALRYDAAHRDDDNDEEDDVEKKQAAAKHRQNWIATKAREAAQSKFLLDDVNFDGRIVENRPEHAPVILSSKIRNPNYVDLDGLKEQLKRGFITAAEYKMRLKAGGGSKTIDANEITDYEIAMKVARGYVDDPDRQAKYLFSIPHNLRRLIEQHCKFKDAAVELQLINEDAPDYDADPKTANVDLFVQAWLKYVMSFAKRCGAYRTYYAFNGNASHELVTRHLEATRCVPPAPKSMPNGFPTERYNEFVAAIVNFVQHYIASVDEARNESADDDVAKNGEDDAVHAIMTKEQRDAAAASDFASVRGKVFAMWSDYRPGVAIDGRYHVRNRADVFEKPSKVFTFFKEAAECDESKAAAALSARKKVPPPPPKPAQKPKAPDVQVPAAAAAASNRVNRPSAAAAAAAASAVVVRAPPVASDKDEKKHPAAPSVLGGDDFESLFDDPAPAAAASVVPAPALGNGGTCKCSSFFGTSIRCQTCGGLNPLAFGDREPSAAARAVAAASEAPPRQSAFASLFPKPSVAGIIQPVRRPAAAAAAAAAADVVREPAPAKPAEAKAPSPSLAKPAKSPEPESKFQQMMKLIGCGSKRKSPSSSPERKSASEEEAPRSSDEDTSDRKDKRKRKRRKTGSEYFDGEAAESDEDKRDSGDETDTDALASDEELDEHGFSRKKGEKQESKRVLERDAKDFKRQERLADFDEDADDAEAFVKRYDSQRDPDATVQYDTHDGEPPPDSDDDEVAALKLPTPPRPQRPAAAAAPAAKVRGRLKRLPDDINAMFNAGLAIDSELVPVQPPQPQPERDVEAEAEAALAAAAAAAT
jgi:hypothetical protein